MPVFPPIFHYLSTPVKKTKHYHTGVYDSKLKQANFYEPFAALIFGI